MILIVAVLVDRRIESLSEGLWDFAVIDKLTGTERHATV
jgi:hypothetical protein